MKYPLAWLFFVILLSFPHRVAARATSFDTFSFRPPTDDGLYLTLYGAEFLEPGQWTSGFMLDYAREPLSQITAAGVEPVVQDLLGAHLSGAYGITPWAEVGLNPNVVLMEKFFDPNSRAESTRVRLGDTRVNGKLRLLTTEQGPIGIAFIPYLDLPTGSGASFVGNNSFAGGGTFALETEKLEDRLTFALNLGYYARDRVLIQGTPFDDLITFGAAGNFLVVRELELIAEFHGGTMVSDFGEGAGTPFEGGGGARYYLDKERRWQITTGISLGVGSGLGNPLIRGLVGVALTPPRPVRGVELQESIKEAFQVYELKDQCPYALEGGISASDPRCLEMQTKLQALCPDKRQFNPKKDDPRCLKLYLNQ